MKCSPIPFDIDERNQLIDDFLSSANGEEVYCVDIAYFLNMDPLYVNYWMMKHGQGKWINGRDRSWWKLFTEKIPDSFGHAKVTSRSQE